LRSKLEFKKYGFLRKHCEEELTSLKAQIFGLNMSPSTDWRVSVDDRIVRDSLGELESKMDRVIFNIEDQNACDIERHTY
jgi:hypothetical protein